MLKFEGNEFIGEIAAREYLTYGTIATQRLKGQAQFTALNRLDCKYRMGATVLKSMEKRVVSTLKNNVLIAIGLIKFA